MGKTYWRSCWNDFSLQEMITNSVLFCSNLLQEGTVKDAQIEKVDECSILPFEDFEPPCIFVTKTREVRPSLCAENVSVESKLPQTIETS